MTNLEDLERLLRDRLDALGPGPRAELLRVLMLPDYDRAGQIQISSTQTPRRGRSQSC